MSPLFKKVQGDFFDRSIEDLYHTEKTLGMPQCRDKALSRSGMELRGKVSGPPDEE
jgi:hypothetical protein